MIVARGLGLGVYTAIVTGGYGRGGETTQPPPVQDGDGGKSRYGGYAIRARLLREFEDDAERAREKAKLAPVPKDERAAIKEVAERIAVLPEFTADDVGDWVTDALIELGVVPRIDHLDWALYFLRVLADANRIAAAALARAMRRDDEDAALLLLLT